MSLTICYSCFRENRLESLVPRIDVEDQNERIVAVTCGSSSRILLEFKMTLVSPSP